MIYRAWRDRKQQKRENQADAIDPFAANHRYRYLFYYSDSPSEDWENHRLKRAYRFYWNPPCALGSNGHESSCSQET